jgi:predicted NBD/HSP70 family sugar kinase
MDAQNAVSLAVDIGGTKMAIALVDRSGAVRSDIQNQRVPFTADGAADPQGLIALMQPYVERARAAGENLVGLGLSVCGNIDQVSGDAILVPNLHWRYVPFSKMVQSAFNLPVSAGTDVRMAALAEHIWGAARDGSDFVWATVGTGYGGYLFLSGSLYGGFHGFAGNFGHTTHDEINGYPCGCGRKGCVETFVAGPAIARAGQQAANSGRSLLLRQMADDGCVTTRMVFAARAAGDAAAVEIIHQVVRLIAINLGGVINLLDLKMIVMGGGVVNASPDFVECVDRRIRDFLMTEEAKRDLLVVKESFPNSALLGAAASVFEAMGMLQS